MSEAQAKSEREVRLEKLKKIRQLGIDPYPAKVERSHTATDFLAEHKKLSKSSKSVTLVGRIMSLREHGASTFAHIQDDQAKVQVYFKQDEVGEENYQFLQELIDVADFIEVSGTAFTTKKGEQSLLAKKVRLISKALRPLPEKWHGLKDVEERYRKRYVDLIVNEDVKARFAIRAKLITSIRQYLDERGYLEVETPTLQPVYGGGYAKPFATHHNALAADFYLRISDEMYLKRLIVGGYEKVYEITKVFRNEGVDRDHNPEFTMFEAMIAYEDYMYGMNVIEEIIERAALDSLDTAKVKYQDLELDFKRPWKRWRYVEAIEQVTGLKPLDWQTVDEAKQAAEGLGLSQEQVAEMKRMHKVGEVVAHIFEVKVEPELLQPTIIYDYPIEISPLAKKCEDPKYVQRFEMFANGFELGNNYSEVSDPEDLEKRFVDEKDKAKAGFEEAHQTDDDYLEAIKHGFPPTCGIAIGLDRLAMLFTNAKNIKEVIFFPTLKPKD